MCLWWETGIEKNASSDFLLKKNRGNFSGEKKKEKKASHA
jgi:hypothetical protein